MGEKYERIMKNPSLHINWAGVERMLEDPKALRAFQRLSQGDRSAIADLFLAAQPYSCDLNLVVVGSGSKSKTRKIPPTHFTLLNALIREQRVKILHHSPEFIRPISPKGAAYQSACTLYAQVEDAYASFPEMSRRQFYRLYLSMAMPQVRSKQKFNVSLLADARVRDEVLGLLDEYKTSREWSEKPLFAAFEATISDLDPKFDLSDQKQAFRVVKACRTLLLILDTDDQESAAEFAPLYVAAQYAALPDQSDTDMLLAFMAGPKAEERYRAFVDEQRRNIPPPPLGDW